jgi:hypothetical protein
MFPEPERPRLHAVSGMVRPWYRGIDPGYGDHLFIDCEELTYEGEPREGVGWMNPYDPAVCLSCLRRYDPDECWRRSNDDYEY